jgi:peptidyl-prolyl cis-trans isomerase NIMA-interacting 1
MTTLRSAWCALLVLACGGAGPRAADTAASPPGDAPPAPLSKAEQCLADATAPRTPSSGSPTSVGVRHILVRHAELHHPRGATRSRADACLRALEALEALQGGASWEEAVDRYSDAAGATYGDLGRIRPDEVKPPFADAAFSLDVDQLSYVVETDAGFHVILRTE